MIRYEMTHRLGEAPVPVESENGELVQYKDIKDNLIDWHPVSEGLPTVQKPYMVSMTNLDSTRYALFDVIRKTWINYITGHKFETDFCKVTAWAERPEPWKG